MSALPASPQDDATGPAMHAWIDAVGLIGPGLPDWAGAGPALAGLSPWLPAPTTVMLPPILPATESRRTPLAVRIALACGHQAITASTVDVARAASVFASSGGDGTTCHRLCEALAGADRRVSPTLFHNSVHNAPSGYWGIAMQAMAASTSLCAHDASFAAGLVDAIAQLRAQHRPVLLVAYDAPYPPPLHAARPVADAFAVAVVLTPARSHAAAMRLTCRLAPGAATPMSDPALERMRRTIPSARCLPLLALLARREAGPVVIEYLDTAVHLMVSG